MKKLTILTTVILAANLLFAQGYHIDTSFYSEALQENKLVDIYFPPGYDENTDMHYSVIYYLHGWFGDQNSMNDMIGTMEYLINNGTIEPIIMVGADNSPDPFDGSMYMNSIVWGNYEDYMINDLISWVESSFRAYPSRDHRALLGMSMGGYGTFRYGILHKDKFRVLAAAASQVLNLTEAVLDSTRLHILQQNQPGPPFFYDYYNSGSVSTTMFMFLVYAAFAPNLNTPQTYINPRIVEWPLDENGDYIDTIVMKAKNQSIDHLIHQLYPEDSVGIFFGCGSGDASIYPCHIAFMDSLEMLGIPYEFYDHTGGHIMPAGFKQRGLIFMDSLLSPPGTPPISCLPDGITFTTQEEIDNFQTNYPDCAEIEGNVDISGNNITNLNGLSVLTSIGGGLSVKYNPALISLTGLDNVTSIGGDLDVEYNNDLTILTGLDNLTSIGGDLDVGHLGALTSLSGLDNLTSIGGYLQVLYNNALTNLTGLEGLTFIGDYLRIYHNNALTSLTGLESLNAIDGSVNIGYSEGFYAYGNPSLLSLMGLENLNSIGGDFYVIANDALTSLVGLEGLASIGGYFRIYENDILTSLTGLDNLTSIGDFFKIDENYSLTSLTGLDNLTSIGGYLSISRNNALTSLTGLENVTSIASYLSVTHNSALTSLTGLDNLTSIGGYLEIIDNPLLCNCEIEAICAYLNDPNGFIFIYLNDNGCSSMIDVAMACGTTLPCLEVGAYYLNSQFDVDHFPAVFPECSDIVCDFNISGNDIVSLDSLDLITSMGGHLWIDYNDALSSLTGLDNLTSIGEYLHVANNNALTSLTGLNNLTSIGGELCVGHNESLTSLAGLDDLTSIGGNLHIYSNPLISLTGLDNVTFIGGGLEITNNSLTSLTGLENVTSIADGIFVQHNPTLTCLTGLENLTAIGGDLDVASNEALSSLTGLDNVTSIGGYLIVYDNGTLTSLTGLNNLISIGGYLYVYGNGTLTSFTGLNNLTSIGESLWISDNYALSSLTGLENLSSIGGTLHIGFSFNKGGNPNLTSLTGLEGLTSIGGGLEIFDNDALTSLMGLDNLTSIGGYLSISRNDVLTSLTELEELNSIGGDLEINNNNALTSLTGLENIEADSISHLTITNNNLLSECHVQSVCDYLAIANAIIEIANNAEGCNDTAQVHAACLGVSIEEIMDEHDFVISPNPNNGFATLSYNTDQLWTTTIEIYNTIGNCIQSRQIKMDEAGQQHLVLDFTALPCGIYFCRMQLGNKIITKKILKH